MLGRGKQVNIGTQKMQGHSDQQQNQEKTHRDFQRFSHFEFIHGRPRLSVDTDSTGKIEQCGYIG
jgi:hypothetical protein